MGTDTAGIAAACTVRVESGRLVVSGPRVAEAVLPPAVVTAGAGVTLTLDGRDTGGRIELFGGEQVTAHADAEAPRCEVRVDVSDDAMAAVLHIDIADGAVYALEDHPEATDLTVTRRLVRTVPAARPADTVLRRALAVAGVASGIDESAVAAAAAATGPGEWAVARGTPPTPGRDARVVVGFQEERDRNPLHTVRRGTLLFTKHPAVSGEDGRTVTGEPRPAPAVQDPPLAGGVGVTRTVDDEGVLHLYAAVDGRPTRAGGLVLVEEALTHPGPVDVATGDVEVFASLTVAGEVGEGRRVRALHDLTVGGPLDRAEVEAGGVLTLAEACLHSRIRAGGRRAALRSVVAALGDAVEDLTAVTHSARLLAEASRERGQDVPPGRILLALLEGSYVSVRRAICAAAEVLDAHEPGLVDAGVAASLRVMHHGVDGLGPHEIGSLEAFEAMAAALRDAIARTEVLNEEEPPTRAAYLQSCVVETAGSLEVTGRGVFTSQLFVGGDLLCEAEGAVVRGGTARVGGRVRLHSAGGEGGARATVVLEGRTDTPDRFHARLVQPGVHVVVNGHDVVFDRPGTDVRVGVDADGRIVTS